MEFNVNEICNKLNILRREHNPYSDEARANEIKQEVIEILNSIPEGTELGQVYKERNSYYTSHGRHLDERTIALKYTKLKDNMWSNRHSKENDANDMALSVLYNSTDIMAYKKAVEIVKIEKQNDESHFTSYAIPEAKIYTKSKIDLPNKLNKDSFVEQIDELEDLFYNYMKEKGYSVSINDDESVAYLGYGGYASKDDKFAVIFKLVENIHPRSFSIFAVDRNGYFALDGETAAIYSISAGEDTTMDEIKNKFNIMLNDIYEKYGFYSKDNRLDFVYNEMEIERKNYTYDLEEEITK